MACLIRWPGKVQAGSVSNEVVHITDLLPTFARVAGYDVPSDRIMDSVDQTPVLQGTPGTTARSWIFTEVFNNFDRSLECVPQRRSTAIRDERFKLIRLRSGAQRFYDLDNGGLDRSAAELGAGALQLQHPERAGRRGAAGRLLGTET